MKNDDHQNQQNCCLSNVDKTEKRNKSKVVNVPPGYCFAPYDHELIIYLKEKVTDPAMPCHIPDINIYMYHPEDLPDISISCVGGNIKYFFSPRERKYRNGIRPSRAAGNGYWKATGSDKHIEYRGEIVGCKRALVYYDGKPPSGIKSNWLMYEYVVHELPQDKQRRLSPNNMELDKWVLCKIYKSPPRVKKESQPTEVDNNPAQNPNSENIRVQHVNGIIDMPPENGNDNWPDYNHVHPDSENIGVHHVNGIINMPPENGSTNWSEYNLAQNSESHNIGVRHANGIINMLPENWNSNWPEHNATQYPNSENIGGHHVNGLINMLPEDGNIDSSEDKLAQTLEPENIGVHHANEIIKMSSENWNVNLAEYNPHICTESQIEQYQNETVIPYVPQFASTSAVLNIRRFGIDCNCVEAKVEDAKANPVDPTRNLPTRNNIDEDDLDIYLNMEEIKKSWELPDHDDVWGLATHGDLTTLINSCAKNCNNNSGCAQPDDHT